MIFQAAIETVEPGFWETVDVTKVILAVLVFLNPVITALVMRRKNRAEVGKTTVETVIQGGDWVNEKMKGLIENLEKKVVELEDRLEKVEDELREEKGALHTLQKDFDRKEAKLQEVNEENRQLNTQVDWLRSQLSEAKQREFKEQFSD